MKMRCTAKFLFAAVSLVRETGVSRYIFIGEGEKIIVPLVECLTGIPFHFTFFHINQEFKIEFAWLIGISQTEIYTLAFLYTF
ncbi:hypothetical protein U27_01303 [Candidatus Vecturithrix granuli]|uniref:Uncharacterized protein n=1 Tax=Vecturithrix granuli TaxID=1499967 RepID=A0A081C9Z8_VECG1|nr:hypothetical protein U27_01303 [Candidatus Vecturithrix granuli]